MNLSTELPLYESIRRELQARIENGELQEGDRIVPEIDLAKQLGVSRSTARKALQCLTDDGFISRTAGRGSFVLPRNHRGRMPGSRVLELAVCASDIDGPGSELARGFLCEALGAGCAAIAWPWQGTGETWPHGASGCAVWGSGEGQAAYIGAANRAGTPIVVIDDPSAKPNYDRVQFDHEGLACALAAELALKGHRSVAVLAESNARPGAAARLAAFRNALADAGVSVPDDLVINEPSNERGDVQLDLLGILGRRERPTALACLHETFSPWVLRAVQELGYTVGKDIELALAIDANEPAPACITVQLDAAQAGREAAKMLLRRLESPQLAPQSATVGYVFHGA